MDWTVSWYASSTVSRETCGKTSDRRKPHEYAPADSDSERDDYYAAL
jgi:hypothetical protein